MRRISGEVTLPDAPKGLAVERPTGLPGRYRIGDVIGEGGMGRVFRAHDQVLGRDVDCVWWSGDRAEQQRFLATWTGELAHPAVVEMRKELR